MVDDTLDVKQKVLSVLESVGMAESRAAKLDVDDFLK
jgi:18S rRNA (adenine1779-N6/adenine1780-N6)-dimethyltransferase